MRQAPTGSYLQTYFSMKIIKIPQRHSNFQEPLNILTILEAKSNLAHKFRHQQVPAN